MKMHELCTIAGVTKKAVAYAIEQGLLTPSIQENGYRDFTPQEAERMGKIAALRSLGLSTEEIRSALQQMWPRVLREQALRVEWAQEQQRILQQLAKEQDWSAAQQAIQRMNLALPVMQRLKLAFPGPFGDFLAAHFAPYLAEPISTPAQQAAWQEIIAWLDDADFAVPEDLAACYGELYGQPAADVAQAIGQRMEQAMQDQQTYIAAHAEEIQRYQAFKATAEYRASPAGRMEQLLRDYMAQSGYNDVFIPAMRRLSPTYDRYQQRLKAANAAFVQAMAEKTKEAP